MTAFGPQSANLTTTRPAGDSVVSAGIDTWFQDCSAAGVLDGTIPTASWFNVVTANLRTAATNAGVTLDDTDDTMIWQAMQAAAASAIALLTASRGVERDTNDFQLTVGQGVDPSLAAAGISALNDKVILFDASGNSIAESTIYEMVKAALGNITGLTFTDATGVISGGVPTHTASATPPAAPNLRDTWWDTDTDEVFELFNDGANDLWIKIA